MVAAAVAYNIRFAGQVFDGQTGLHYNYYRDHDPATGRYIESDPIGLKGGINTFAYSRDVPDMLVYPSGLFTLRTVGSSWSMVDSLPGTRGGLTNYLVRTRCTCKQSCGSWTLSGCSSAVIAKVNFLNGLEESNEAAFYRNSETQHVADLFAGAGSIYQAGTEAERTARTSVFCSKYDCELNTLTSVSAAVLAAANSVYKSSGERWDKSGLHTWPWPPWDPRYWGLQDAPH